MKNPLSIQLWSLREFGGEDYTEIIRVAARAGFGAVELWNSTAATPEAIRDTCGELGLAVSASHVGLDRLRSDLDAVIAEAKAIGLQYILCPWLDPEPDLAAVKSCVALGEEFNRIGEAVRQAGLTFGFHNHWAEFTVLDGKYALDWIFESCEPRNVCAQIDTYFAHSAGPGAVEAVRRYGIRCQLVHLKDGNQDEELPLGTGEVDFKAAVEAAEQLGSVDWYAAEHGLFDGSSEEPVKQAYLRLSSTLGIA